MTEYNLISKTIFSALLFSLISCGEINKPGESTESEIIPENIVELRDDQVVCAGIKTGSIDSVLISGRLKVNGTVTVSPRNLATVCMPSGGFVKYTSIIPGTPVRKGETLAIIENQEFIELQENYLETKIEFGYVETEFIRHSELYIDEVYSQNNVQEVTATYKSLKAKLKALEQKLLLIGINPENLDEDNISNSVSLVSPIAGYVKTVNVNIGKYVSPSDVLIEIVNSDELLLELTLFEKDAAKASVGQKILFFINNESEQHEAVICQTGKSIDSDKTYKVYANVPGSCKNVLPGMYVNAIIETSGKKLTAVPSDAIVSFDDKDYIFIFEKNKEENGRPFSEYRMVEIHKDNSDGIFTGIILPGDIKIETAKVVLKGAYNILSAKKNAGEMAC
jgi:RND family efflux transporter MFP subunit